MKRFSHDWFDRDLPANVEIGERTWVYSSYAFLHFEGGPGSGVRIGADCGIYDGTCFEIGPEGRVEIGDYCSIVGAIIHSNARVRIEDFTFLAHEVVLSSGLYSRPGKWASREEDITIGRNCWIGARAILLGGARLGEGVIVGAGAVVTGEVPAYAVIVGNPGRVVGSARPRTELP